MSLFHGQIETKTIKAGGKIYRQEKFYCSVHGWFDLFVFPDSETDHADCQRAAEHRFADAPLKFTKIFKQAA